LQKIAIRQVFQFVNKEKDLAVFWIAWLKRFAKFSEKLKWQQDFLFYFSAQKIYAHKIFSKHILEIVCTLHSMPGHQPRNSIEIDTQILWHCLLTWPRIYQSVLDHRENRINSLNYDFIKTSWSRKELHAVPTKRLCKWKCIFSGKKLQL
jgi:hypothetical protein